MIYSTHGTNNHSGSSSGNGDSIHNSNAFRSVLHSTSLRVSSRSPTEEDKTIDSPAHPFLHLRWDQYKILSVSNQDAWKT